jgi:hypothetical protein
LSGKNTFEEIKAFVEHFNFENGAKVLDDLKKIAPEKVTISRSKHPESAQHILDAQAAGHSKVLTLARNGADANRAESLKGMKKIKGKQLDEYPPAFTAEGGKGASVRPIAPADNMGAGARIGNLVRKLMDGAKFIIEVLD